MALQQMKQVQAMIFYGLGSTLSGLMTVRIRSKRHLNLQIFNVFSILKPVYYYCLNCGLLLLSSIFSQMAMAAPACYTKNLNYSVTLNAAKLRYLMSETDTFGDAELTTEDLDTAVSQCGLYLLLDCLNASPVSQNGEVTPKNVYNIQLARKYKSSGFQVGPFIKDFDKIAECIQNHTKLTADGAAGNWLGNTKKGQNFLQFIKTYAADRRLVRTRLYNAKAPADATDQEKKLYFNALAKEEAQNWVGVYNEDPNSLAAVLNEFITWILSNDLQTHSRQACESALESQNLKQIVNESRKYTVDIGTDGNKPISRSLLAFAMSSDADMETLFNSGIQCLLKYRHPLSEADNSNVDDEAYKICVQGALAVYNQKIKHSTVVLPTDADLLKKMNTDIQASNFKCTIDNVAMPYYGFVMLDENGKELATSTGVVPGVRFALNRCTEGERRTIITSILKTAENNGAEFDANFLNVTDGALEYINPFNYPVIICQNTTTDETTTQQKCRLKKDNEYTSEQLEFINGFIKQSSVFRDIEYNNFNAFITKLASMFYKHEGGNKYLAYNIVNAQYYNRLMDLHSINVDDISSTIAENNEFNNDIFAAEPGNELKYNTQTRRKSSCQLAATHYCDEAPFFAQGISTDVIPIFNIDSGQNDYANCVRRGCDDENVINITWSKEFSGYAAKQIFTNFGMGIGSILPKNLGEVSMWQTTKDHMLEITSTGRYKLSIKTCIFNEGDSTSLSKVKNSCHYLVNKIAKKSNLSNLEFNNAINNIVPYLHDKKDDIPIIVRAQLYKYAEDLKSCLKQYKNMGVIGTNICNSNLTKSITNFIKDDPEKQNKYLSFTKTIADGSNLGLVNNEKFFHCYIHKCPSSFGEFLASQKGQIDEYTGRDANFFSLLLDKLKNNKCLRDESNTCVRDTGDCGACNGKQGAYNPLTSVDLNGIVPDENGLYRRRYLKFLLNRKDYIVQDFEQQQRIYPVSITSNDITKLTNNQVVAQLATNYCNGSNFTDYMIRRGGDYISEYVMGSLGFIDSATDGGDGIHIGGELVVKDGSRVDCGILSISEADFFAEYCSIAKQVLDLSADCSVYEKAEEQAECAKQNANAAATAESRRYYAQKLAYVPCFRLSTAQQAAYNCDPDASRSEVTEVMEGGMNLCNYQGGFADWGHQDNENQRGFDAAVNYDPERGHPSSMFESGAYHHHVEWDRGMSYNDFTKYIDRRDTIQETPNDYYNHNGLASFFLDAAEYERFISMYPKNNGQPPYEYNSNIKGAYKWFNGALAKDFGLCIGIYDANKAGIEARFHYHTVFIENISERQFHLKVNYDNQAYKDYLEKFIDYGKDLMEEDKDHRADYFYRPFPLRHFIGGYNLRSAYDENSKMPNGEYAHAYIVEPDGYNIWKHYLVDLVDDGRYGKELKLNMAGEFYTGNSNESDIVNSYNGQGFLMWIVGKLVGGMRTSLDITDVDKVLDYMGLSDYSKIAKEEFPKEWRIITKACYNRQDVSADEVKGACSCTASATRLVKDEKAGYQVEPVYYPKRCSYCDCDYKISTDYDQVVAIPNKEDYLLLTATGPQDLTIYNLLNNYALSGDKVECKFTENLDDNFAKIANSNSLMCADASGNIDSHGNPRAFIRASSFKWISAIYMRLFQRKIQEMVNKNDYKINFKALVDTKQENLRTKLSSLIIKKCILDEHPIYGFRLYKRAWYRGWDSFPYSCDRDHGVEKYIVPLISEANFVHCLKTLGSKPKFYIKELGVSYDDVTIRTIVQQATNDIIKKNDFNDKKKYKFGYDSDGLYHWEFVSRREEGYNQLMDNLWATEYYADLRSKAPDGDKNLTKDDAKSLNQVMEEDCANEISLPVTVNKLPNDWEDLEDTYVLYCGWGGDREIGNHVERASKVCDFPKLTDQDAERLNMDLETLKQQTYVNKWASRFYDFVDKKYADGIKEIQSDLQSILSQAKKAAAPGAAVLSETIAKDSYRLVEKMREEVVENLINECVEGKRGSQLKTLSTLFQRAGGSRGICWGNVKDEQGNIVTCDISRNCQNHALTGLKEPLTDEEVFTFENARRWKDSTGLFSSLQGSFAEPSEANYYITSNAYAYFMAVPEASRFRDWHRDNPYVLPNDYEADGRDSKRDDQSSDESKNAAGAFEAYYCIPNPEGGFIEQRALRSFCENIYRNGVINFVFPNAKHRAVNSLRTLQEIGNLDKSSFTQRNDRYGQYNDVPLRYFIYGTPQYTEREDGKYDFMVTVCQRGIGNGNSSRQRNIISAITNYYFVYTKNTPIATSGCRDLKFVNIQKGGKNDEKKLTRTLYGDVKIRITAAEQILSNDSNNVFHGDTTMKSDPYGSICVMSIEKDNRQNLIPIVADVSGIAEDEARIKEVCRNWNEGGKLKVEDIASQTVSVDSETGEAIGADGQVIRSQVEICKSAKGRGYVDFDGNFVPEYLCYKYYPFNPTLNQLFYKIIFALNPPMFGFPPIDMSLPQQTLDYFEPKITINILSAGKSFAFERSVDSIITSSTANPVHYSIDISQIKGFESIKTPLGIKLSLTKTLKSNSTPKVCVTGIVGELSKLDTIDEKSAQSLGCVDRRMPYLSEMILLSERVNDVPTISPVIYSKSSERSEDDNQRTNMLKSPTNKNKLDVNVSSSYPFTWAASGSKPSAGSVWNRIPAYKYGDTVKNTNILNLDVAMLQPEAADPEDGCSSLLDGIKGILASDSRNLYRHNKSLYRRTMQAVPSDEIEVIQDTPNLSEQNRKYSCLTSLVGATYLKTNTSWMEGKTLDEIDEEVDASLDEFYGFFSEKCLNFRVNPALINNSGYLSDEVYRNIPKDASDGSLVKGRCYVDLASISNTDQRKVCQFLRGGYNGSGILKLRINDVIYRYGSFYRMLSGESSCIPLTTLLKTKLDEIDALANPCIKIDSAATVDQINAIQCKCAQVKDGKAAPKGYVKSRETLREVGFCVDQEFTADSCAINNLKGNFPVGYKAVFSGGALNGFVPSAVLVEAPVTDVEGVGDKHTIIEGDCTNSAYFKRYANWVTDYSGAKHPVDRIFMQCVAKNQITLMSGSATCMPNWCRVNKLNSGQVDIASETVDNDSPSSNRLEVNYRDGEDYEMAIGEGKIYNGESSDPSEDAKKIMERNQYAYWGADGTVDNVQTEKDPLCDFGCIGEKYKNIDAFNTCIAACATYAEKDHPRVIMATGCIQGYKPEVEERFPIRGCNNLGQWMDANGKGIEELKEYRGDTSYYKNNIDYKCVRNYCDEILTHQLREANGTWSNEASRFLFAEWPKTPVSLYSTKADSRTDEVEATRCVDGYFPYNAVLDDADGKLKTGKDENGKTIFLDQNNNRARFPVMNCDRNATWHDESITGFNRCKRIDSWCEERDSLGVCATCSVADLQAHLPNANVKRWTDITQFSVGYKVGTSIRIDKGSCADGYDGYVTIKCTFDRVGDNENVNLNNLEVVPNEGDVDGDLRFIEKYKMIFKPGEVEGELSTEPEIITTGRWEMVSNGCFPSNPVLNCDSTDDDLQSGMMNIYYSWAKGETNDSFVEIMGNINRLASNEKENYYCKGFETIEERQNSSKSRQLLNSVAIKRCGLKTKRLFGTSKEKIRAQLKFLGHDGCVPVQQLTKNDLKNTISNRIQGSPQRIEIKNSGLKDGITDNEEREDGEKEKFPSIYWINPRATGTGALNFDQGTNYVTLTVVGANGGGLADRESSKTAGRGRYIKASFIAVKGVTTGAFYFVPGLAGGNGDENDLLQNTIGLGGWNGGGHGNLGSGGGGGASDVRIGFSSNDGPDLEKRQIVAGGGGGGSFTSLSASDANVVNAGGIDDPVAQTYNVNTKALAGQRTKALQTERHNAVYNTPSKLPHMLRPASKGIGGSIYTTNANVAGGGGGGGYFGGGAGVGGRYSGGGGSSFINKKLFRYTQIVDRVRTNDDYLDPNHRQDGYIILEWQPAHEVVCKGSEYDINKPAHPVKKDYYILAERVDNSEGFCLRDQHNVRNFSYYGWNDYGAGKATSGLATAVDYPVKKIADGRFRYPTGKKTFVYTGAQIQQIKVPAEAKVRIEAYGAGSYYPVDKTQLQQEVDEAKKKMDDLTAEWVQYRDAYYQNGEECYYKKVCKSGVHPFRKECKNKLEQEILNECPGILTQKKIAKNNAEIAWNDAKNKLNTAGSNIGDFVPGGKTVGVINRVQDVFGTALTDDKNNNVKTATLYIFVGGTNDKNNYVNGGWNGGVSGVTSSNMYTTGYMTGSAGASDVRVALSQEEVNSLALNDMNSLSKRILVAGGAGGSFSMGENLKVGGQGGGNNYNGGNASNIVGGGVDGGGANILFQPNGYFGRGLGDGKSDAGGGGWFGGMKSGGVGGGGSGYCNVKMSNTECNQYKAKNNGGTCPEGIFDACDGQTGGNPKAEAKVVVCWTTEGEALTSCDDVREVVEGGCDPDRIGKSSGLDTTYLTNNNFDVNKGWREHKGGTKGTPLTKKGDTDSSGKDLYTWVAGDSWAQAYCVDGAFAFHPIKGYNRDSRMNNTFLQCDRATGDWKKNDNFAYTCQWTGCRNIHRYIGNQKKYYLRDIVPQKAIGVPMTFAVHLWGGQGGNNFVEETATLNSPNKGGKGGYIFTKIVPNKINISSNIYIDLGDWGNSARQETHGGGGAGGEPVEDKDVSNPGSGGGATALYSNGTVILGAAGGGGAGGSNKNCTSYNGGIGGENHGSGNIGCGYEDSDYRGEPAVDQNGATYNGTSGSDGKGGTGGKGKKKKGRTGAGSGGGGGGGWPGGGGGGGGGSAGLRDSGGGGGGAGGKNKCGAGMSCVHGNGLGAGSGKAIFCWGTAESVGMLPGCNRATAFGSEFAEQIGCDADY